MLPSLVSAYRTALLAFLRAAARTTPTLVHGLQANLAFPEGVPNLKGISEIDRKVVAGLDEWGDRATDYFTRKATEVKEILLLVTRAAQTAGEKDEKYFSQLTGFSSRLHAIANLDDLSGIRQSLSQSALELQSCADHMAKDSREIVSHLRFEVAGYQSRLAEAEKQASLDVLTGLDNRRGIERKLQDRIDQGRRFCAILLDLNRFKQINDAHGHLAGDQLLKEFAAELRARFCPSHSVGRWGGDEFLILFEGDLPQAQAALRKAGEWLFGSYRIQSAKVMITAAAGLAEWIAGEQLSDLLKRADAAMYRQKAT